MYEAKNPLSATSYTNKDFQSIYEELLETVKNLAKNWDPTISNESDPGVVLLKLNAIIGDKNNYNIDKNVLENYPETYTQEFSARSQYKQLGYKMPWYRAASTRITFRWVGEALSHDANLIVPKYTMVSDSEENIVYTTLEDAPLGRITGYDSKVTVKAMQGIINTLKIAGAEVMTLSNLDRRNRLYIRDRYIAENGIFVSRVSSANAENWKQVDNVETQPSGTCCYEFDVDPMNGHPYLQFPDDIRDLIGAGLVVRYIVTNGMSGNVAAKTINKFYNVSEITLHSVEKGDRKINLSEGEIQLFNTDGTTDGSDPETIEEAYKSFKRTVGTFETLVTLRDYLNAIYTSTYVSNAVVTDRTNDIQSTYRIVDKDNSSILGYVDYQQDDDSKMSYSKVDAKYFDTHQDKIAYTYSNGALTPYDGTLNEGETYYVFDTSSKYMDAFDMKFYLLKSGGLLNSLTEYNDTFTVDNSPVTYTKLKSYLDGKKSIQHDRKDIQPDLPFMMQNVYPIKLKIVPSYKLSEEQQNEVKVNILNSLMKLLNSRNCEFGEEPSYDLVYSEIESCDERIKVVILDDFVYTTYAVYMEKQTPDSEPEFKYVPISDYNNCESIIVRDITAVPRSILDTEDDDSIKDHIKFKLAATANTFKSNGKISVDELKNWLLVDASYGVAYKINKNIKASDSINKDSLIVYSDRLLDIRKEVIARNILAGVTPLFDVDDSFRLSLNMKVNNDMSKNVEKLSTGLRIAPFGLDAKFDPRVRSATYTLKDNESLRFYAPSFISDRTYSNYVKFELVLARPTLDKTRYSFASPEDEASLRSTYGDDGFYQLSKHNSISKYEKVVTEQYEALKRVAPRFKYGHHYRSHYVNEKQEFSFANGKGGMKFLTSIDSVKKAISSTAYTPEFEPYMFYSKTEKFGKPFYVCLTKVPDKWGTTYTDYYIKKSTNVEFIPVVDTVAADNLNPDLEPNCEYQEIEIKYELQPSVPSILEGELYAKVEVTDNESGKTTTWYTLITDDDDLRTLTEVYTRSWSFKENSEPGLGKDIFRAGGQNWTEKWRSYAIKLDANSLLIHDDTYFSRLKKYLTKVYYKDVSGNYTLVMSDTKNPSNLDADGEYYTLEDPVDWETAYHTYYVKAHEETEISMRNVNSIVPQFSDNVYSQTVSDTSYVSYSRVANQPLDWEREFQDYYILVSKGYNGLHTNSPEAADWRAGRLSLYVPSTSYDIPANTEYQLQPGDYITFFYRETDEDDAPYTYERYTHEYDASIGLPTIIKANFTIHASNHSNCLIHPENLNSSGYIRYDKSPTSQFQVIFGKMYDEYDLSGTKKIEMRVINNVKLDSDNNKYYYVITSNKELLEDEEYFSMTLDKSITSSGKIRYTHTLQNDEYFIYTNKDKSLFEILSSGTLIEYFPGDSPRHTDVGGTITISNPSIDVQRIMYSGVDAIASQCVQVASGDTFKLVEQQIYALTSNDSVQIQLDESFDYDYKQVTGEDTFDNKKSYCKKTSEYVDVKEYTDLTGETMFPSFIENLYYRIEDGTCTLLKDKPSDWGRYEPPIFFVSVGDNYESLDSLDENGFNDLKAEGILYSSEAVYYPEFTSDSVSPVTNYNVSYRAGSSAYTALPSIRVNNGDYGWNATASLNLKIDSGSYQKIEPKDAYSVRSITIGDNATYPSSSEDKPLFIMSDVPLDKVGGKDLDVTYITLAGDRLGVNILAYQEILGQEANGSWISLGDGAIGVRVPAEVSNEWYELCNISLDKDFKYILPIENYSDTLKFRLWTKAENVDDWVEAKCLCHRTGIVGNDKHYYELPTDTVSIRVAIPAGCGSDSDSVIRLDTLLKYQERDIFTDSTNNGTGLKYGITTRQLLDRIYELDSPKKFNYTHVPSDEVRIDDPLLPQSLFDVNHVYNKFTMSKAVLNEYKLGGFSTIFVNNR